MPKSDTKLIFRYFSDIVYFRVVVGYDDLVYNTASGMEIILQHGQSWTFECRYKLNSVGDGETEVIGIPKLIQPVVVEDELQFKFNYYTDETYNTVRMKYFNTLRLKSFYLRQLNGQSSI